MWRNLVALRLWEPKVAGSNPAIPIYPCDGTEYVARLADSWEAPRSIRFG